MRNSVPFQRASSRLSRVKDEGTTWTRLHRATRLRNPPGRDRVGPPEERVGFLSMLLPGVRDFRTPFVVGALWTTAGVLWAWHWHDGAIADLGFVRNVNEIVRDLPDVMKLGVLAFTIYLTGLVVKGIQDWFVSLRLRRRASAWFTKVSRWLSKTRIVPEPRTRDYLADAARERFANYPPAVREVARQILLEEYELADVILTSRSPEQYQEYDRWRSEAEFREGVWVPLFFVGVGLGFLANGPAAWLIPVGVGIVSLILKSQGVLRRRKADERLASAVYFDLASTPLFDALLSDMKRRSEERAAGGGAKTIADREQIAWAIEFFKLRGLDRLVRVLLLHSPQHAEMKGILDAVAWGTRRYIERSNLLQDLILVAYGGIEWSEEAGELTNRAVRVEITIAAHERLYEHLAFQAENGDLRGQEVAEEGALAFVRDSDIPELKGDATDEEWLVAVRIENSQSSKYARYPETAYLQDRTDSP